ncbi:MAG: helix-hairpin-helix domain-containing protein [Clostridiales bacterium]|nr:helix-hairpin-helix domain-containing protein [Clostridiales bacterium]
MRWKRITAIALCVLCLLSVLLVIFHIRPTHHDHAYVLHAPKAGQRVIAAYQPEVVPAGSVSANSGGLDELVTVPGIGQTLAENLIAEREQNGRFYFPEDLLCVRGIGEKTLLKLLPYLNLD